MNNYHEYVIKDGKLIGDFEKMYQECDDPWLQDTVLHKSNQYVLDNILSIKQEINLLDIGCGKGFYTNLMFEKTNANIDAIDISKTAIKMASEKYSHINFIADNFTSTNSLRGGYNMVIISQILWYILDEFDLFMEKLKSLIAKDATIIFIQTYYNPKTQKYGNEFMTCAEDILDKLPFEVQNLFHFKNYNNGIFIDTESVIVVKNK